jgi:hypothetical protein
VAAVAEVFRAVEQVRADAHIKELEFNDKANERQFLQAREQRASNENGLPKLTGVGGVSSPFPRWF